MLNVFGRKEVEQLENPLEISYPALEGMCRKTKDYCDQLTNETKAECSTQLAAVSEKITGTYGLIANCVNELDGIKSWVNERNEKLKEGLLNKCENTFSKKDESHGLSSSISEHTTKLKALEEQIAGQEEVIALVLQRIEGLNNRLMRPIIIDKTEPSMIEPTIVEQAEALPSEDDIISEELADKYPDKLVSSNQVRADYSSVSVRRSYAIALKVKDIKNKRTHTNTIDTSQITS